MGQAPPRQRRHLDKDQEAGKEEARREGSLCFLSKQFVALEQTQCHLVPGSRGTTQRGPAYVGQGHAPGCLLGAQLAALSEVRIVPRSYGITSIHPLPIQAAFNLRDSIVALGPELEIKQTGIIYHKQAFPQRSVQPGDKEAQKILRHSFNKATSTQGCQPKL